jgi:hypothetical protein
MMLPVVSSEAAWRGYGSEERWKTKTAGGAMLKRI